MGRVLRWIFVIVVGLALFAGAVYALIPQPTPVDVADVVLAPMNQTVDEEGKTRIRERYVVSSPLGGRLRRITLDPGDQVTAEQSVLAIIEPTDPQLLDARAHAEAEARVRAAQAAVQRNEATMNRAQAAAAFAEDELARLRIAHEGGGANPRELAQAELANKTAIEDFRAAQFALEIAQFELELAQSALLYTRGGEEDNGRGQLLIQSPITGDVLRVFQESVAVVTPGTPLLEVGDRVDLELVIDVLSTDAVRILPGQRVLIDHWGGDGALEAVVRLVEPSAFTKVSALGIEEQRVNVIADFVTPADRRATLGDGYRVDASIIVWEAAEVLQIPTSAAFRDQDRWAVFVVEDELAILRQIEVGQRNGSHTQVVSGLGAGDIVITHPSDAITDGARVQARGER